MSWLNFSENLAKILFPDTHAKILKVCTYLDTILPYNMAKSWRGLQSFRMFCIKMYQVLVHCVCKQLLKLFSTKTQIYKSIVHLTDQRKSFSLVSHLSRWNDLLVIAVLFTQSYNKHSANNRRYLLKK